jgi:heptosyltransferase-2
VRIRHEVLSALELVGLFGCKTSSTNLNVSTTIEGEAFADDFISKNSLNGNFIIAIHPGSSQAYIRWNRDNFAELADAILLKHKAKVILLGSAEEKPLLEYVASKMKQKPVLLHSTALTNIVSVLKRSNLFIGHSTGPMHIASALKVPVVALFGAVHPLDSFKEWGPWNTVNAIVSVDLGCKHCHPTDCKTFDCMRLIKPQDVLKAAESLIEIPI